MKRPPARSSVLSLLAVLGPLTLVVVLGTYGCTAFQDRKQIVIHAVSSRPDHEAPAEPDDFWATIKDSLKDLLAAPKEIVVAVFGVRVVEVIARNDNKVVRLVCPQPGESQRTITVEFNEHGLESVTVESPEPQEPAP